MSARPNARERIAELVQLAAIYADDGALRTAAARLREAADLCDEQARLSDLFLNHLVDKGILE